MYSVLPQALQISSLYIFYIKISLKDNMEHNTGPAVLGHIFVISFSEMHVYYD